MIGSCIIDGRDIYTEFGVIITEGGYSDLLTFPAITEPDTNDWAEENGVEVDLTELRLEAREITMFFASIKNGANWRGFYNMLIAPGYRNLSISDLQKSWRLRVVEVPEFEDFLSATVFTVKFSEDIPVRVSSYPQANADIGITSVLAMDGKTIDKYGIIVEDGLSMLQQPARLKEALSRTNSKANGVIYDTQFVKSAEKEVVFKCCLNATQMADFWNLYNAFFGDLTKPNARIFSLYNKNYEAYYRKSENFELIINATEVVCRFDLTIVVINEL